MHVYATYILLTISQIYKYITRHPHPSSSYEASIPMTASTTLLSRPSPT